MNHKQLVQQMADMKAELDNLRSQVSSYENVEEAPAPVANTTSSRRKLLKRMAVAGIGGIGALGLAATVGSNNTVLAATSSNNAIEATGGSDGYGLQASGGLAPLYLIGSTGTGAPTTGNHQKGELYVDSAGALYYCIVGNNTNAGTWRKVLGTAGAGGVSFLSTPERYIDTRSGGIIGPTPPATAGRLPANTTYTYQITGRNGQSNSNALQVPAGATAIIVSIGVVSPDSGGFIYAFPGGASTPTSTVLSWPTAGNYRTGATVALSASGQVSVRSNVGTDFNLDVIGYYN